jgi:hypothetical protein
VELRSGARLVLLNRIADRWSIVEAQGLIEAWLELDLPSEAAA